MTLEHFRSDIISTKHGFFTRKGGKSSGIYNGLNCGLGSDDMRQDVIDNRTLVADTLGVTPENLRSVHQIHSTEVVTCTDHIGEVPIKADAMVTATKGIALGILSADCPPILFQDPKSKIIGAAHSGWKGAIGGIAEATICAMEALGAKRENISGVVGPAISQRAYEVGPEFFEVFIADDTEHARFFAQGKKDRMHFDLPSFCLQQLRKSGIRQVEWTGHCTYSDPERFFSYRRSCHHNEADYGRLISTICLQ